MARCEFDRRHSGDGPLKVAAYVPGQGLQDVTIAKGRKAVLACGGKYVWVEIIDEMSLGKVAGKVLFIQPPGAKVEGISEGDTVTFEEAQIIGIS